MRITLILIIFFNFLFCKNNLYSQARLSHEAEISLLTCAPGDELYSLFGHSAIRVNDPLRRYDKVFNYGIFNFDTPNFLVKFVRGKLLYRLGVENYKRFEFVYNREKRPFIEQVINLTHTEKEKVLSYLIENAKPENREYKYDFFFDNCASRIRDVFQDTFQENLAFVPNKEISATQITYRQGLDYYLAGTHKLGKPDQHPWTDFGMDLILGIPADQKTNFETKMYLPEFLSENMGEGILKGRNLFKDKKTDLYKKEINPLPLAWYFPTPLKIFSILFILSMFLFFSKMKKISRVYFGLIFILLGLSGWLFVLMWTVTNHQACYQNLNMLWMNPFHLFFGIQILRNRVNGFWKKYILFAAGLSLLVLVGWKFLPQEFHFSSIPIILTSLLGLFYFYKKQDDKA